MANLGVKTRLRSKLPPAWFARGQASEQAPSPIAHPDFDRVYHFHVRKTAGTSLNASFWALGGLNLRRMGKATDITRNGLRYVRNSRELIGEGNYFFANSHMPAHELTLPPRTYTVTILRDPVARVISYYRYLVWAATTPVNKKVEPAIEWVRDEAQVVNGGFQSFLTNIPEQHLLTQVFLFSERMDPGEAAERALDCSAVCFTETFSDDLKQIGSQLQLDLAEAQERRFGESVALGEDDLAALNERLAPEHAMIARVRDGLPSHVMNA